MFSNNLPLWPSAILSIHFALLLILCVFGLHRFSIVFRWFLHRNDEPEIQQSVEVLPQLTVQIPLYNERLVAQRIVDAVAAFDYPKERLQIQMVDDSTDETLNIIAAQVKHYQAKGLHITHVTCPIYPD